MTERVLDSDSFTRPCRGQVVGGDLAVIEGRNGRVFVGIIDVLGHGPEAHELAVEIERLLRGRWDPSVTATLNDLHEKLKGTRGAAVGLGVLDVDSGTLQYVGVGNTVIRRVGPRPTTLPSQDGVVGIRIRTPLEHSLHMGDGDVVVLYTDGVRSHFDAADYPGLTIDGAGTVAARVVEKFGKDHDDASCIAMRFSR